MINKKLGRNDMCWCGSGLKFKKCHLGRSQQEPIPLWQADQQIRANYSERCCSVPDNWQGECSGSIIKAHTVPRSTSLKAIARAGHVYGIRPSLLNIEKFQGRLVPELIGINNASTFTGFCGTHDDRVFSAIEKGAFVATAEQCFLLAYRAFSRECYTKKAMLQTNALLGELDRGHDREHQMHVQMMAFLNRIGAAAGVNDNNAHKKIMDQILISRDFNKVRSLVLELDSVQPVMAAGGTNPTHDFEGREIQDLGDLEETPEMITVTSFCSEKRGYIVWTWLENEGDVVCRNLVESLLTRPQDELVAYSIQYILKSFENFFIEPFWWEGLSHDTREFAIDLIHDSVDPTQEFNASGMRDVVLPRAQLPSLLAIHKINF